MQELENAISAIEDLISADVFEYGSDEDRELNSVLSMLVNKLDESKKQKGRQMPEVGKMKAYTEMSTSEIIAIVDKGGDELHKLNHTVREYLDNLDLSQKARDIIAQTDFNSLAECFGGLFSAAEVESCIETYYED